jgi:hypothetical protein
MPARSNAQIVSKPNEVAIDDQGQGADDRENITHAGPPSSQASEPSVSHAELAQLKAELARSENNSKTQSEQLKILHMLAGREGASVLKHIQAADGPADAISRLSEDVDTEKTLASSLIDLTEFVSLIYTQYSGLSGRN